MTNEELLLKFKVEVYDRAKKIDPGNEHDWNSLACGFFLALGTPIEQACDYGLLCAANNGELKVDTFDDFEDDEIDYSHEW